MIRTKTIHVKSSFLPVTQEEREGEATLIEFVNFDPDTSLQTWNVKFKDDDKIVVRKILIGSE